MRRPRNVKRTKDERRWTRGLRGQVERSGADEDGAAGARGPSEVRERQRGAMRARPQAGSRSRVVRWLVRLRPVRRPRRAKREAGGWTLRVEAGGRCS